jgi:hypothetical protein
MGFPLRAAVLEALEGLMMGATVAVPEIVVDHMEWKATSIQE